MSPTVSICVPTFEGREWVASCLESAFHQTYRDCEVIVCDDGSSDNTAELAGNLLADGPFPYILVEGDHVGLVGNWQRCLDHCQGDYVKFLFQDDLLDPQCITRLMEVAGQGHELVFGQRHVALVGTDPLCRTIEEHCRGLAVFPKSAPGRTLLAREDLFAQGWNPFGEPTSALFRRVPGMRVPEGCGQFSDVALWLQLAVEARVGFVAEKVATFSVHPGQTTYSNLVSGQELVDLEFFLSSLSSQPCWELFSSQTRELVESTLLKTRRTLGLPLFAWRRRFYLRRLTAGKTAT